MNFFQQHRYVPPILAATIVGALFLGTVTAALVADSQPAHALAPVAPAAVYAWGDGGTRGDGGSTDTLSPNEIAGFANQVISVSRNTRIALALQKDGSIVSWGAHDSGALGDGSAVDRNIPGAVTGFGTGSGAVAVSTGRDFSVALKNDGSVWTWGLNTDGELGNGTRNAESFPKVSGLGPGSGTVAISSGCWHTLALKDDGSVWGWGLDQYSLLGDGGTNDRSVPAEITGLGTDNVAVSAGCTYSLALKKDGSVWAWGRNTDGELGDGTTVSRTVPTITNLGPGSDITAISAGHQQNPSLTGFADGPHSLALKSDGSVLAWGSDWSGELGDGGRPGDFRSSPLPVTGLGPHSGVTAISAGVSNSLALKSDGSVQAWGAMRGDGTARGSGNPTLPVAVPGFGAAKAATYIDAGGTNGAAASATDFVAVGALTGTATSISAASNPAHEGDTVSFSLHVGCAPNVATGVATITDNGTPLTTVAVGFGSANFSTAALTAGKHDIQAIYSGDGACSPSSGSTTQFIRNPSSVDAGNHPGASTPGTTVTIFATVWCSSPAPRTGVVTFRDNGTYLGYSTVDSTGWASWRWISKNPGTHTLTADYSGDDSCDPSTATTDHNVTR